MEVVIDANILFAALIKNNITAELLMDSRLTLYAPEFLLEEFAKYEEYILQKTQRTKEEWTQFLIKLHKRIQIIPQKAFQTEIPNAERISPDSKDMVYLVLTSYLKVVFWSNDKKLKQHQRQIPVITTNELLQKLS